ncbi:ABC transporter permease, partial [Oceanivirga salmonicida]|uniref:ABC transporter permease n=1 Tax=Oceanivirga salmonicida TaxID=1769291 RepID=UPI0009E6F448
GIVLVSGYKLIYGETGLITNLLIKIFPNMPINWFEGGLAVILTMTFAMTSNHLIFLTNTIRGIDYQIIEAAENMGAKTSEIVFKILIPMLKPTLFALTVLLFLSGLSAVSAPLIVGGKSFQTINPMIIAFSKTQNSRDIAMLLSIILGISTVILIMIMNRIERKGNYISVSKTKSPLKKRKIENKILNIIVHILAYILFIIYILPIIVVIIFSFSDITSIIAGKIDLTTLTLHHYKTLFTRETAFSPYIVSLIYSFLATLAAVIFALVISKIIHKKNTPLAKFYEYTSLIPWLLPATLIALGFVTTYDVPKPILFNIVLLGTPAIMVLGYTVVKIPFAFRMIRAAFFSVEDSLEEAAKSMGATAFYSFRKVVLPILMPAVLSVGALIFNNLLTNYDVSVFLYHPLFQPLGVAIVQNTQSEVDLEAKAMIYVYSVTLMLISGLVIYYVYGRDGKKNKK